MIKILFDIESKLIDMLTRQPLNSMYIDYKEPFVQRIWWQYNQYRIYLHKIQRSSGPLKSFYHPHPWTSAMRIIKGSYEMGIGTEDTILSKLHLCEGCAYEMTHPEGWHYVNPIDEYAYSIMVTGEKYVGLEMPAKPDKEFRKLKQHEMVDIMSTVMDYYEPIKK